MDQEVDSRFACPICCEVLKNPTVLEGCQHRFCEACLDQTPPSPGGHDRCPVCRRSFQRETDILKDKKIEREISQATAICSGCRQELALLHFNSHSVTCSKRTTRFTPPSSVTRPTPPIGPNRSTFKCPYCSQSDMDIKSLLDHVNRFHGNNTVPAVCPVCASMPWGNPQQTSSNFIGHLNLRHKFEYDTYVDYEQDDDAALEATLEASRFQT